MHRPILSSMKPERVLLYVVGGIVLLAVTAGVVAALRPAPEFEPGTPEAAVQGYVQAVFERDGPAAETFLASDSRCDVDDIERGLTDESARVVLRDSEVEDGTARVRVEFVYSSADGPFDAYEYSQERTFRLVREGEEWRLTGEPWPAFPCREGDE